jgi:hypothetical protein
MVGQRLLWVGVAIIIAFVASLLFHRFDPAKEPIWPRRKQKSRATTTLEPAQQLASREPSIQSLYGAFSRPDMMAASTPPSTLVSYMALIQAELRLMLKGISRWWYLVALGLWIGSLLVPLDISRGILIAIWIWPLLLWSKMGARESTQQTSALVFSCAYPLQRQFPATWTAGVVVAVATGSGVAVRMLLAGDLHGLAAWLSGALFIPSLALALGVWSGTSKTFEAIYTMWWYIGPCHQMPYFDFMGTTVSAGRPAFYCAVAALFLLLAFAGRRAQLAYA